MNPTTVAAFFDELEAIEKTAGPLKDSIVALKKGTQVLKKGVTAPLKAGESAYNEVGQRAFLHASKLVGPDKIHKAALKSTEILHKIYA